MSGKIPPAVAKLLPNVPGLGNPPTYVSFLRNTLRLPENRKALAANGKSAIDTEYERCLKEKFDDITVMKKYISESTCPESLKIWNKYRTMNRLDQKTPFINAGANVTAAGLKLPSCLGNPRKQGDHKAGKIFEATKYADFAKKAERMNPSTRFDRRLMDEAFRAAVAKVPNNTYNAEKDKKHIARCLGKESDQYWRGRETD